ncbi:hypothetical protein [Haladaptatus sp. DJG-WS-42]|uniref:hypothetical protein n=1 Tax=Haladaptatus sp. DJG-WS-42 TaxID=3120516 RepID=UPI0030D371A2
MKLVADALSLLLTATGVFLILVSLATIAGMPWTTKASALAAGIQVGGALVAMALGASFVWAGRKA